ncbi:unnamed protein product [Vicia faba]|uniref:BED-type domain-containing protein n=1 Tax=Vicia faba TaxID=3906 RepID=A0AAV1B5U5_VICFA|nr:unnamed protein product [Vicia faba]
MTKNVEHISLTTSASTHDEVILPPYPKEKKRQIWSNMWNHFTAMEGDEKKAKCQYCGVLIKYSNRTSGMQTHLGRCTAYDHDKTQPTQPNKRRKTNSEGKIVCSPSYSKFDQEECQALLVKTFMCCELPFCFVKNEVFRKLLITLQPRFYIPSRSTSRLDIWALYLEEKEKLKNSCQIMEEFV